MAPTDEEGAGFRALGIRGHYSNYGGPALDSSQDAKMPLLTRSFRRDRPLTQTLR